MLYSVIDHAKRSQNSATDQGHKLFRDFCFRMTKRILFIFDIFKKILNQRFGQCTNCHACEIDFGLSRSRVNRHYDFDTSNTNNNFSEFALYDIVFCFY